jgi:DNA-directed RNA polymerase beta' subunit
MIKLFRRIRYDLVEKNKTGKYLKYAIGEIILVVIGILIALQINNANELSKQNKLVKIYENSLISEIQGDLKTIKKNDSTYTIQRKLQQDYLNYYKKPNADISILIQKMDSIKNGGFSGFSSSAYTIDDLISTGNLSLFTKEKKEAILTVKNVVDFFDKENAKVQEQWATSNLEFQNAIDLTSFWGPPYYGLNFDGNKPEDWRYNLKSEQYRLFGNKTIMLIRNLNFQIAVLGYIKKESENLLTILEND